VELRRGRRSSRRAGTSDGHALAGNCLQARRPSNESDAYRSKSSGIP